MNPPALSYLKATFWERLAALIIDELILLVPIIIFQLLFTTLFINLAKFSFVVETLLAALYNILFLNRQGATIGKKAMNIKVVTDNNYGKIPPGRIVLRETLGKWISKVFFDMGNFWVLIDKKRQTWHDKIANTMVVKVDEKGHPIAGNDPPVSTKDKVFFVTLILVWGLPIVLLPVFVFFYLFIAQPYQVKGLTMMPTLKNNEYFIANKIDYKYHSPKRGDIIVFKAPNSSIDFIKRIIGLPGERITILGGYVYIDGKELKEPYLNETTKVFPGSYITEGVPIVIPANSYFVLGDNREHSNDSRSFGPIARESIIGKYWFTYWMGRDPLEILQK